MSKPMPWYQVNHGDCSWVWAMQGLSPELVYKDEALHIADVAKMYQDIWHMGQALPQLRQGLAYCDYGLTKWWVTGSATKLLQTMLNRWSGLNIVMGEEWVGKAGMSMDDFPPLLI